MNQSQEIPGKNSGNGQKLQNPGYQFPFSERTQIAVLFSILLLLRVVYAFHLRFDTDEPQHLHVIWGWVNGHLQYRDIFDNHGPVFHLLCAPLFRAIGERPDIAILMRLAMIPLVATSLWCVYKIGTSLYSMRVGLWAALFTGLYPEFLFTSTEFRTDNLWTVLWLVSLVIATGSAVTPARAIFVGVFLGTAFGVTVKTGLMVGSMLLAASMTIGHNWIAGAKVAWRHHIACAFAGIGGLVIAPATLALWFSKHGALKEFLYCNISHNLVPHAQNWQRLDAHVLWFPVFLLLCIVAHRIFKNQECHEVMARRSFLILVAGAYFSALKSFFPTLSRQDDLPLIPLVVIILASVVAFQPSRTDSIQKIRRFSNPKVAPAIAFLELIAVIVSAPFWHDNTKHSIAMLSDVLRATRPGDYVMDATGETIFRMRPYYYALEAFTKVRILQGSIKDDISERLAATRTTLVRPRDLTKTSRAFVQKNYLPIGHDLYMLGKSLESPTALAQQTLEFDVAVPERYTILDPDGKEAAGKLDGEALIGSRFLDKGNHTFARDGLKVGRSFLFLSTGLERGFSPHIRE